MSYESYNHNIVRSFNNDELMLNEYCDGIHCGNSTSLITLRPDKLKLFCGIMFFVQFIDRVCMQNYFLVGPESGGKDPNRGLSSKYTRIEYSFKHVSILHGWSILAKQCDPGLSPYDFT